MATAGGGKFYKRPFTPEMNEEPQNVSQEAGQNISTEALELSTHQGGDFASIGMSELEQILKHKTFTWSETQHLIALLHSRTIEALLSGGSVKRHKHGDERDHPHTPVTRSRVLEEEIASSAELAKAYINTSQTPRQDLKTPMASPQHQTTMEKLPDELLLNIFIRLLAKQLAQMRSVSKSWNALLSESSFIKSHLHHSIHNKDQILLVFHDKLQCSHHNKQFTVKLCQSPCLELTNFTKLPVNPQPECTNGIRVIGSVNGLICSSYGDSIIQIWNPSLSTVLTLPPYSTPSSHAYNSIEVYFRFGFDPKTDDYKVVKLTGIIGPHTYFVKWWLQVEIYSMRKGSWELITGRFPSHITKVIDEDYVCVDGHEGHLHWLCCIEENMDSKTIIVAFDLGSGTFREMPLPDSILDNNHENVLGVLGGEVCVMSQVGVDGRYEVWVMDEYESWVKRHVFSQFINETCVFGFTSRNEFVIEDDGYLVVYDPSVNKQKILEDHCPENYDVHNIVEYVDTLVWVTPAKQ